MSKTVVVCTVLAETSPQALPLGAACIASAVNAAFKDCGESRRVRAELVSASLEDNLSPETLASRLTEKHPAAVCFSVYVWNRRLLERTAALVKERAPHVPIVAGGPEVTANPESFNPGYGSGRSPSRAPMSAASAPLLSAALPAGEPGTLSPRNAPLPVFDYLVTGEGEDAVPALLAELFAADDAAAATDTRHAPAQHAAAQPSVLHGTRTAPERLSSPYLDGTLDPARYDGGALWELARGCPFKCSYCYESKGEKTVVHFPTERIRAELDLFVQKKVRQVFVLDPTYNADKKRALDMLAYIRRTAPDIFFHFECRAEFLDAALAQAFASIPCSLQIGLQSAHEHVLALVHRGFNKKDFIKKIGLLNKSGAVFGFDLIYGLPGDSLSGFRESIDFAVSLYPNSLEIFRLSVLPGTDLYDRRSELGLNAQERAPYLIRSLPTFPEDALNQAESLGKAASLFYSAGRAVSWFHSVTAPLHCKPSAFFTRFAAWLDRPPAAPTPPGTQSATRPQTAPVTLAAAPRNDAHAECAHAQTERLQVGFITAEYEAAKQTRLLAAATDLIRLNGAISRAYAEGESSELTLSYHPDDVLSPYAQDLAFFCKNARRSPCRVRVGPNGNGPQWKIIG